MRHLALAAALAAVTLAIPTSASAAPGDVSCLFEAPSITWAHVLGTPHASYAEAMRAAGASVVAIDDPFYGRPALLVSGSRGKDLLVKSDRGVIRFADAASHARANQSVGMTSFGHGPWVVASITAQEDQEESEDGLVSHPEIDARIWLIDTRAARVVAAAEVSVPYSGGPDGPEWSVDAKGFSWATGDDTGTRPWADVERCAGPATATAEQLANAWIALGRKLTKTDPAKAHEAFSQAIAVSDAAAAWSGRGYVSLSGYPEARKRDSSSLECHRAIDDFNEALKRSKDKTFLAQVHYNIGECHRLRSEGFLPEYRREALGEAAAAYRASLAQADREPVKKRLAEVEAAIAKLR